MIVTNILIIFCLKRMASRNFWITGSNSNRTVTLLPIGDAIIGRNGDTFSEAHFNDMSLYSDPVDINADMKLLSLDNNELGTIDYSSPIAENWLEVDSLTINTSSMSIIHSNYPDYLLVGIGGNTITSVRKSDLTIVHTLLQGYKASCAFGNLVYIMYRNNNVNLDTCSIIEVQGDGSINVLGSFTAPATDSEFAKIAVNVNPHDENQIYAVITTSTEDMAFRVYDVTDPAAVTLVFEEPFGDGFGGNTVVFESEYIYVYDYFADKIRFFELDSSTTATLLSYEAPLSTSDPFVGNTNDYAFTLYVPTAKGYYTVTRLDTEFITNDPIEMVVDNDTNALFQQNAVQRDVLYAYDVNGILYMYRNSNVNSVQPIIFNRFGTAYYPTINIYVDEYDQNLYTVNVNSPNHILRKWVRTVV